MRCRRFRDAGVTLAALACLAAVASVPTANAVFTSTTQDTGNTVAAGSLTAPTGLAATNRCGATAPPTWVASATANMSGAGVALTLPTATTAGDLLLVNVVTDGTSSAPSGWSLVFDVSSPSGPMDSAVYQRVATASDVGTLVTFPVSGGRGAGGLLVLGGTTGDITTADAGGIDNGVRTAVDAPSVNSAVANTVLLTFYALNQGSASLSTPAGMTQRYGFGGTGMSLSADTAALAATGATGVRTSTASTGAAGIGLSFLVEPAGAAAVDLSWTATPTTWATGYEVTRGGVVAGTVAPRTAVAWTDTSPGSGTVVYTVTAVKGTWRSPTTSATVSVTCP